jgi:hypothetical protein
LQHLADAIETKESAAEVRRRWLAFEEMGSFSSAPEEGATFFIELPVAGQQSAELERGEAL